MDYQKPHFRTTMYNACIMFNSLMHNEQTDLGSEETVTLLLHIVVDNPGHLKEVIMHKS